MPRHHTAGPAMTTKPVSRAWKPHDSFYLSGIITVVLMAGCGSNPPPHAAADGAASPPAVDAHPPTADVSKPAQAAASEYRGSHQDLDEMMEFAKTQPMPAEALVRLLSRADELHYPRGERPVFGRTPEEVKRCAERLLSRQDAGDDRRLARTIQAELDEKVYEKRRGVTASPRSELVTPTRPQADSPPLLPWGVKPTCELKDFTTPTVAAVSPDGSRIATADGFEDIGVHDATTGRRLSTLTAKAGQVTVVAFSPDGRLLAGRGGDHHLRVWEVVSGKQLHAFRLEPAAGPALAFSGDGKLLAGGTTDGRVLVWDMADGKLSADAKRHAGPVSSLAFHPTEPTLLSGGGANKREVAKVNVWNLTTKTDFDITLPDTWKWGTIDAHTIPRLAVSPDGRFVAVVSAVDSTTSQRFNLGTRQEPQLHAMDFKGRDHFTMLYGLAQKRVVWNRPTGSESTVFSPDGLYLFGESWDGDRKRAELEWHEAATGESAGSTPVEQGRIVSISLPADGRTVVTGGVDGSVKAWPVNRPKK